MLQPGEPLGPSVPERRHARLVDARGHQRPLDRQDRFPRHEHALRALHEARGVVHVRGGREVAHRGEDAAAAAEARLTITNRH
jgi:hypothetical protein